MLTASLRLHRVFPRDKEIQAIHDIRAECAADLLIRHGPGHWATTSSLAYVRSEASAKSLYAVKMGSQVIATFALARKPPLFFDLEDFAFPEDPAAYLSALAVLPDFQGQGIGTWCMQQMDAITLSWDGLALRFDAYDSPAGAGPFYERCGYQPCGKFSFNKVPLVLYEKAFR